MKNIFQVLFLLFSTIFYSQTAPEKVDFILKKNGSIEKFKFMMIDMTIKPLQLNADAKVRSKLMLLEKKLSDQEISKRLSKGFMEIFTENEINEMFAFYNSSAVKKLENSSEKLDEKFNKSFEDINAEIKNIAQKNKVDTNNIRNVEIALPTIVERQDGFYEVLNYDSSKNDLNYLILSSIPSVTAKDFMEVKSIKDEIGRNALDIKLTPDGAKKFQELTRKNTGKPIAIFLKKKVVSAPIVQSEISGGRVQVSGNFSDEDIKKLVESFKK